jgi:hypothetical protein
MPKPGSPTMGGFSTIDLLIEVSCFVTKEDYYTFDITSKGS